MNFKLQGDPISFNPLS